MNRNSKTGKVIHKYFRKLKPAGQFKLCNGKTAMFAENISWFWRRVTCSKCLKLKKG